MSGYLSLSRTGDSPLQVGELVNLTLLVDEKLEEGGWKVKTEEKSWLASGSLTIAADSLRQEPADGGNSKFSLQALVHQHGPARTEAFTLVHSSSGREVNVLPANLETEVAAPEKVENVPWTLPAIPIGGWNYLLIGLLAAALVAALLLAARRFLRRLPGRKKRDHKAQALQALQALQKYARAKKAMKQEEWKKFSFELAGIIRRYSDVNFQIDSSDMTDREFLAELRLQPKARQQVDSLATVLSTIDEVRYGKKDLDATVVPSLLLESRRFVEQTYRSKEEEGKK